MSDDTGQAPKKETVYGGSTPAMDNKAFAQPSGSTGTVYGGPTTTTQGTVYGGASSPGTVFDESKFVAKKPDASVAIKATTTRVRWATLRFFVVAAVSLVGVFIYWPDEPALAISSGVVCAIFLAIGIFAFRLHKSAFIAGLVVYALDTCLLLFQAITTDGGFILYIKSIVVHGIILYRLWVAYGHLQDLHSLAED